MQNQHYQLVGPSVHIHARPTLHRFAYTHIRPIQFTYHLLNQVNWVNKTLTDGTRPIMRS